jgi:hypothetical protein
VHRELWRKHVTLSILWEKYIAGEPGGSTRAFGTSAPPTST